MRCHKPNTDQTAEFTILVNGSSWEEYALPFPPSAGPNTIERFIPIRAGDQLTISGEFSGTVLHGSFDLLVDGSFLADRRIEGSQSGETKYYRRRRVDYRTVFDMPGQIGGKALHPADRIIEGNLVVTRIDNDFARDFSSGQGDRDLGVGSLAIVISLNQDSNDNYDEHYPSITCGSWQSREVGDGSHSGIRARYALEVQPTDLDVSKPRQRKHKRHFGQTHFGNEPWAKFIFYYRSLRAIEKAGCVKVAENSSHALEAGPENASIHPDLRVSSYDVNKYVVSNPEAERLLSSSRSSAAALPDAKLPDGEEIKLPFTPSPRPGQKKQLFGRTLQISVDKAKVAQKSPISSGVGLLDQPTRSYQQERQDGSMCDATTDHLQQDQQQRIVPFAPMLAMSEEDVAQAIADVDNWSVDFSGVELPETLTESELWMNGLGLTSERSAISQITAVAGPSQAATEAGSLNDTSAGEIDTTLHQPGACHQKYKRDGNSQQPTRMQLDNSCSPERLSSIAQSSSTPAIRGRDASCLEKGYPRLSGLSTPSQVPSGCRTADLPHRGTEMKLTSNEPSQCPLPIIQSDPGLSLEKYLPSPFIPNPLKRPLSSLSASREGSPRRKPRLSDLKDRKAELLRQLEEKKQRKIEAQKAYEDLQRQREEEELKREKAEEQEIKMLEKMAAEEDEQYEQLVAARKAAEAELEQTRLKRAGLGE